MRDLPVIPPFLKWPGGKRWFVSGAFADLLPTVAAGRYIEPFLGAGSVFFHLRPCRALLGDANVDLIATYRAIKEDWRSVVRLLETHQSAHGDRYYYKMRDRAPTSLAERAARFIYLNRTCFNGIYRVNRRGVFNVPKGTRSSVVLPTDDFESIGRLLETAELRAWDFEPLVDAAQAGDLVFADPPYTVRHNVNGFVKYNERLFSWDDQVRLVRALSRARDRGVRIVATNANHASVRGLYARFKFGFHTVDRYSGISADVVSRKHFGELVVIALGRGRPTRN
jgi:DNA adenine methylase